MDLPFLFHDLLNRPIKFLVRATYATNFPKYKCHLCNTQTNDNNKSYKMRGKLPTHTRFFTIILIIYPPIMREHDSSGIIHGFFDGDLHVTKRRDDDEMHACNIRLLCLHFTDGHRRSINKSAMSRSTVEWIDSVTTSGIN